MKKSKYYARTHFSADVILQARDHIRAYKSRWEGDNDQQLRWYNQPARRVQREDETWEFDSDEEFFAEYRRPHDSALINIDLRGHIDLFVDEDRFTTKVSVRSPSRSTIEQVFEIFDRKAEESQDPLPPDVDASSVGPTIFIGHGHSPLWRELSDDLHHVHGFDVDAYEFGARAGMAVRDVLEAMLVGSSFAVLVMTPEDEQMDGEKRARQNVVHEAGLFQGRLGFSRAIAVCEAGVESFSNIDGINQVRFSQGHIREAVGDVLGAIRREFPA